MPLVRGLGGAVSLFAAAFGLHVVAGATDQSWLFGVAVAVIFVVAAGFPAIALRFAGLHGERTRESRAVLIGGWVIGALLTLGALWAVNDRAFAWWQFPLAPAMVALVSARLGWSFSQRRSRASAVPSRKPRRAP